MGDYKLIIGYPGLPCDWLPVSQQEEGIELETSCQKSNITERGVYLYNLKNDPLETTNLASNEKAVLRRMKHRLDQMGRSMVPADDPFPNFFAMRKLNRIGALVPGWCQAK